IKTELRPTQRTNLGCAKPRKQRDYDVRQDVNITPIQERGRLLHRQNFHRLVYCLSTLGFFRLIRLAIAVLFTIRKQRPKIAPESVTRPWGHSEANKPFVNLSRGNRGDCCLLEIFCEPA